MKSIYHRWLDRDLERWEKKGWITAEGARQIREETRPRPVFAQLQTLVGLLGAVLLVFAALTFVAANWQEMARLTRVVLLLAAMWTTFAGAWWLQTSGRHFATDAAILLGLGLFGSSIVLISQMYHIDGHYPDALLLWVLGALLTAVLLWSRAALAASLAVIAIWTSTEMLDFGTAFHWLFLPVWALAASLAWAMKWRQGLSFAISVLALFAAITIIALAQREHWPLSGMAMLAAQITLAFAALAYLLEQLEQRHRPQGRSPAFIRELAGPLAAQALTGFVIALFLAQIGSQFEFGRQNVALTFSGTSGWTGWSGLFLALATLALLLLRTSDHFRLFDKVAFIGMGAAALLIVFIKGGNPWIFGAFYLVLGLGVAAFGQHRHDPHLVNLGLTAFGAEILYIYFQLFGSMLQTSLFFLVGGLLLMALAFAMTRLRRLFQTTASDTNTDTSNGARTTQGET